MFIAEMFHFDQVRTDALLLAIIKKLRYRNHKFGKKLSSLSPGNQIQKISLLSASKSTYCPIPKLVGVCVHHVHSGCANNSPYNVR